MSTQYSGSRLRAHHFAGIISFLAGISFLFEHYSFSTPFVVLGDLLSIPVTSQQVWGIALIVLGVLCIFPNRIYVRAVSLILCTLLWCLFGTIALWASLFGPSAYDFGSYTGIASIGVMFTCILGTTNLRRDFYRPKKKLKLTHRQ